MPFNINDILLLESLPESTDDSSTESSTYKQPEMLDDVEERRLTPNV